MSLRDTFLYKKGSISKKSGWYTLSSLSRAKVDKLEFRLISNVKMPRVRVTDGSNKIFIIFSNRFLIKLEKVVLNLYKFYSFNFLFF